MTQILERPAATEATTTHAAGTPRGGGYVTLPAHLADPSRTEASYISLPGAVAGAGSSKAQGTYVTLHSAPLGETAISYTLRG